MEIRGMKCLLCGALTGMMNEVCQECDGTDLVEYTDKVSRDSAFWGLTVSKEVNTSQKAFHFEEAVLAATKKWREKYDGHGVEVQGVPGVGTEVSLVELHWYFDEGEGHIAVDLQQALFGLRPGLVSEAMISVTFYDDVQVGDD
tara:strand:- start:1517 stop:1948 length:432 start_codon:yes stop_codon:yes gene_type:complete